MLRAVIAVATLIVAGIFALQHSGDPALRIPIILFGLGVALFAVMSFRKLTGRDQPPPEKGQFVTVCLGIPSHSPKPVQTFNALPAYCQELFRVQ